MGRNMATETAQSNSTQSDDPRAARLAILAAARRVHHRDGAGALSFASIAKEAGVAPETISTHFQNAQEILVALAAEDLGALARTQHEVAKDAQPKAEAPQPQTNVRKKHVMPAQLEQVMRDVAPDQGKEVISGAMARLERRLQVMEKAFTDIVDRHEKSVQDRGGAITSVEESISALLSRMDAADKHSSEMMGELRSAVSKVAERLDALEGPKFTVPVLDSAGMALAGPMTNGAVSTLAESWSAPSAKPEMPPLQEMSPPAPGAMEQLKADEILDSGTLPLIDGAASEPQQKLPRADGDAKPDAKESYLSAARRAALAAAETETTMKATLDNKKSTRRGNRAKFLMFACLAPVAILGTAFVVLNRNAVTAGPAEASQPIAPPASATAQIVLPPPQDQPVPASADPGSAAPASTADASATAVKTPEVVVASPANPLPSQLNSASSLATLTQTAEAGDVRSMRDVGLKYLAGDGVDANETEAARWLMRAAYKGEAVSEYWLATLYARGKGVPADAFQANHWYEAAAKQGNRRAMHSLAVANFQGWGIEKNLEEAARWFKSAAELGLTDSQFNLAVLYERGSGVPQSLTEAYKWYAIAAAQGDKEADNRLAVLAIQLKPADLALAQSAIAAFKPQPMNEAANMTSGPSQLPGG